MLEKMLMDRYWRIQARNGACVSRPKASGRTNAVPLSLEEGNDIVPPADSICQVFKEIFMNNFDI